MPPDPSKIYKDDSKVNFASAMIYNNGISSEEENDQSEVVGTNMINENGYELLSDAGIDFVCSNVKYYFLLRCNY